MAQAPTFLSRTPPIAFHSVTLLYHVCMGSSTQPPANTAAAPSVIDLEREYLLQNYSRYPIILRQGKGAWLTDVNGKRYLDLISGIGVNALGHAHPRITRVIREQAGLLIHSSNLYYHEYQGPLAKRLAEISGLQRAFFCNSGTEAMEGALKMVRSHGGKISPEKFEIVSLENSFHGRTLGALSITGQAKYRKDFEPLLAGAKFVPANDLAALEAAVSERTAGIVLECIQGEGGVFPLSVDYARKARELATKRDALLVFDEIQCGVGRPGRHFAYQLAEPVILPDIMLAAKPLACGLPLGVIMANEKAAATIGPGMHGTTFGGGVLACRVALEFLDILEDLLPHIYTVGAQMRTELNELKRHFPFIKEVRGFGLMIGVELDVPGKQVVLDALEEGLLINCTHDTVIRLLPPYILTEPEADRAIKGLVKVFRKVKPAA
jgi:acetylornithine/N-succinyldiaminopimelate aminotransferase